MKDKDHLKEILKKIDKLNEPIDLEEVILNAIQKEENLKVQLAYYKTKGIKAFIVSVILIVILGILFSLPSSVSSVKHSLVTYTSIILILIILFIQLEIAGTKIFNNLKNNLS